MRDVLDSQEIRYAEVKVKFMIIYGIAITKIYILFDNKVTGKCQQVAQKDIIRYIYIYIRRDLSPGPCPGYVRASQDQ